MNSEEFKQIISIGNEQNGIEFKPGFLYDKKDELLYKVIRAIIAMANRRDGGLVILGVEEIEKELILKGLSSEELLSLNYDNLSNIVNNYADPNIEFKTETVEYNSDKYLVIRIPEFIEIPIICKKNFKDILREGACYVRSKKKPESSEIPTQTEMRELLDLAKVKALRKYVTEAQQARIELSLETDIEKSDLKYDNELKLSQKTIYFDENKKFTERIKSRGHLVVEIRPSIYQRNRENDIFELENIINSCQTDLRGWPIPYIDWRNKLHKDENWIGQFFEWQHNLEYWQLFKSGYFYFVRGFPIDWRDHSSLWPADENWKSGEYLGVVEITASFVEIYEFAVRLTMSKIGYEYMDISISVNNIYNRKLYNDSNHGWPLFELHESEVESAQFKGRFEKETLIADPLLYAKENCKDLFSRFGYKTDLAYIDGWINQIHKK